MEDGRINWGPLIKYCALLLVGFSPLLFSQQANIQIGRIEQVIEIGGGFDYVRIKAPFRNVVPLVVAEETAKARGLAIEHWAVVEGEETRVEDQTVLKVEQAFVTPFAVSDPASLEPFFRFLAIGRTELIMIALAILLLGLRGIKLTTQILLAATVAALAWTGMTTAAANGLITGPDGLGFIAIAFACAAAMILGTGFLSRRDWLIYRLVAWCGVWLTLPVIAVALDWSTSSIKTQALVALVFPFPLLAPIVLGATLMTQALEPQDLWTRWVIIAACAKLAVLAHIGLSHRRKIRAKAPTLSFAELKPNETRTAT